MSLQEYIFSHKKKFYDTIIEVEGSLKNISADDRLHEKTFGQWVSHVIMGKDLVLTNYDLDMVLTMQLFDLYDNLAKQYFKKTLIEQIRKRND